MQEDNKTTSRESIPYIEISDVRTPVAKKSAISRRGLFRSWLIVSAAIAIPITAQRHHVSQKKPTQKIEVTRSCVGCTGCVIMCPVLAISVAEDGITVDQEKCISCGYCQAGCATDGIRVLQENKNHA